MVQITNDEIYVSISLNIQLLFICFLNCAKEGIVENIEKEVAN